MVKNFNRKRAFKWVSLSSALVIVTAGAVLSIYSGNLSQAQRETNSVSTTKLFERSAARVGTPYNTVDNAGQEYTNTAYSFNNPNFLIPGDESMKNLIENISCSDENVVTSVLNLSNNTRLVEDSPLSSYTCENSLLRFESFSKSFDSSQTLFSLIRHMANGNMALLPRFDNLDSLRFHSAARGDANPKELYFPEADTLSTQTDPLSAGSFALWARWAQAVYDGTLNFNTSGAGGAATAINVPKFRFYNWLSLFYETFITTPGRQANVNCLDTWGSYRQSDYNWKSVFTHELYHHYLSSSLEDESVESNPVEEIQFQEIENTTGTPTATTQTLRLRKNLKDRIESYFSSIKTLFWDNANILNSNLATGRQFQNDVLNYKLSRPVQYSLQSLAYGYSPEEAIVRLMSLLTFHDPNIRPETLIGTYDVDDTEICAPSFPLRDYQFFTNNQDGVDINPFDTKNFDNAVTLILDLLKFNQPISAMTKQNNTGRGISFQGWSEPNKYRNLVLEEKNPSNSRTRRHILDLSWTASDFFVRRDFNSPDKTYVQCLSDLTGTPTIQYTNQKNQSCQQWTTPTIFPEQIFEKFFPGTAEVNLNVDGNNNDIYLGLNMYFWNDLNSDGLITDNEKTPLDDNSQNELNARLMPVASTDFCKISIVKNESGQSELRRYISSTYSGRENEIDPICEASWSTA